MCKLIVVDEVKVNGVNGQEVLSGKILLGSGQERLREEKAADPECDRNACGIQIYKESSVSYLPTRHFAPNAERPDSPSLIQF